MIANVQIALALPAAIAAVQLSQAPFTPIVSTAAATVLVKGSGPIADRYGITVAAKTPGLNPQTVSASWGITVQDANIILGVKTPGTLGLEVAAVAQTARDNTTLAAVIEDTASLTRLTTTRDQKIQNAVIALGVSK